MKPLPPKKPKKERSTGHTMPDTNFEVLPSSGKVKSGVAKKKQKQKCLPKTLSKKKRKRLEDIVARRQKKENRSSVLSKLSSLPQISAKFESFINVGQKRKRKIESIEEAMAEESEEEQETRRYAASESEDSEKEDEAVITEETSSQSTPTVHFTTTGRVSKAEIDDDEEPSPFPTGKEIVHGLKRIALNRRAEVVESREKLPILSEEHNVLDAVATNSVSIICGSTGSGKTTQVPQFLYEAGYAAKGIIGVTEPRRVAAISMSHRVAHEMNLPNSIVSYKIRFERDCGPDTKIKFMTDGTLMKELEEDFLLMKYSVIILDEAHERSEFTDILISLLSRIVPLRKKRKLSPLKLVIMSATLKIEDFINKHLFKVTPPVVNIEGRQFPVTAHFQKRTPAENEYLKAAYKRICKVHRTLPPGGILVFVTGKEDITILSAWLSNTFPRTSGNHRGKHNGGDQKNELSNTKVSGDGASKRVRLDNYAEKITPKQTSDVSFEHEMHDEEEEDLSVGVGLHLNNQMTQMRLDENSPLFVLPLHSYLSAEEQNSVFLPPPESSRMCVISTNVAETSITIPNIRYVVDTGKEKRKVYDTVTGVSVFIVDWVSKASANQRAGRAGRTSEGHCYRLYSSAVFQDFVEYNRPLILQRPVDDVVLLLKNVGIMNVSKFPFPNSPSRAAILAGEKHLYHLGALTEKKTVKGDIAYVINELGQTMACMGLAPRFAKMVAMSNQQVGSQSLLPYTIALVSAFTVRELFCDISTNVDGASKAENKTKNKYIREVLNKWRGDANTRSLGDVNVMLNAIIEFEETCGSVPWCKQHGLRYKAMQEIRLLRKQLTDNVNSILPQDSKIKFSLKLRKISSALMLDTLRQVLLSGLGDRVARRAVTNEMIQEEKANQVVGTDGNNWEMKLDKNAYQAVNMECTVYIHPHSVLYDEVPEYIAFQEIVETSKVYAKDCFAIEEKWLPLLFPIMCTFSPIMHDTPPFYDEFTGKIRCLRGAKFAKNAWPISPQVYECPPKDKEFFKLFAMFLLEGKVFNFFKYYVDSLLSKPVVMIKPWSKLQSRTQTMLVALANSDACSKQRLLEIWEENPKFLLKEFLEWLPADSTFAVEIGWPPKE